MSIPVADTGPADTARHQALLYDSSDQLLAGVVPYIREGIAQGETVLVVTSPSTTRAIREELGSDAENLTWGDSGAWYQRLGTMFESYRAYLAGQTARNSPTRIAAEPDLGGRSRSWLREYMRFEAAGNIVHAPYRTPVLCLLNQRQVPPDVVEDARATHQDLLEDGHSAPNPQFVEPRFYLRQGDRNLQLDQHHPVEFTQEPADAHDLASLRHQLRTWADRHRVPSGQAANLITAANEIATNALKFGLPPITVSGWRKANHLICECFDAGPGLTDPTAGYHPPEVGQSGSGLWVLRQLADLVQISSQPEGTRIRLSFAHP